MLNIAKLVKDYEDTARSSAELLPWMCMPAKGLVLNKDGALMACYEFDGQDAEGLDITEIDRVADQVERSLSTLNDRIIVWSIIDRRRINVYPDGEFENEASAEIDALWRQNMEAVPQYINSHSICFVYKPPAGAESFFERMAGELNRGASAIKALANVTKQMLGAQNAYLFEMTQLETSIAQFEDILSSFEQTVLDLRVRRLGGEDLLGYLHARANPCTEGQPVRAPRVPNYLDSYLCDNRIKRETGTLLRFSHHDPRFVGAISVKDWPGFTYPQLLDNLLAVPAEITISQIFRVESKEASEKFIVDKERHNRNLEKSIRAWIKEAVTQEESRLKNQGRVLLAEDANAALAELTAHNRLFGYYNLTVCGYGNSPEEAEFATKVSSEVITNAGYLTVREGMHLLSAWSSTMPGQWAKVKRWFFCSGGNVADLFPARVLGVGDIINEPLSEAMGRDLPATTVLHTEYYTPYFFSFQQSDLAHTFVVGPTRSGKSVFLNFLVSQFRKYRPCRVYIFDKDYSCRIPTLLQGGQHIDLAGEMGERVKLNPLSLLGDEKHWAFLTKWLEIPLTARGYAMQDGDDEILASALRTMRTTFKPNAWRLSSLAGLLPQHLANALSSWCGDGLNAHYFDNEEDAFSLGDFTCMEMKSLLINPVAAVAFLEYAFYRINLSLDGTPTLIEIEEAWFMLSSKDFNFLPRLDDWLRTLAKRNAFVVMATQSLDELAKSDISSILIDSIPNRIFLANRNALTHEELYIGQFQLNRTQLDRIRLATRKEDYYIVTPKLSRMVKVRFPRELIARLTSVTAAQKIFTKAYKSGSPTWRDDYVAEFLAYTSRASAQEAPA